MDIDRLLSAPDPGVGAGPRRSGGGGVGMERRDRTTIVAVVLLSHEIGTDPKAWKEFFDGYTVQDLRMNAWGDCIAKASGMCLDRAAGNRILFSEANAIRAVNWLKAHRTANATVAQFLGVAEGVDLIEHVREIHTPVDPAQVFAFDKKEEQPQQTVAGQ